MQFLSHAQSEHSQIHLDKLQEDVDVVEQLRDDQRSPSVNLAAGKSEVGDGC